MQKQASVSTLNVKVHNNIIRKKKQAKYGLIERAASRKCLLTKKKKKHGRTAKLYLTKRQDFWKSVQG